MTSEIDAALSRIGSSRMCSIRSAIAGLSAARTAGDTTRVAGAERLIRSEVGGSALTSAQKSAILAGCNLALPQRPVAAPVISAPRVTAPISAAPRVAVSVPAPRVTPPMQRPTDGADVVALIEAVGLAGFKFNTAAKTWSYTQEVKADGGDVLELIQRVSLRGFRSDAA